MQTSAIATLYNFSIREGEEEKYFSKEFQKDLLKVKDLTSAHKFASTYGTHYLKKAKMGARFQENIYFPLLATSSEISKAQSSANTNAFGGSETSVAASSENSSNTGSKSISVGGARQYGLVDALGECGDLLGRDNILFPVEYQSAPIYTILKDNKYADAKKNLQEYTEQLYERGTECGEKNCSGAGTCVSDPGFFQKPLADGMPFSDIFRKGECICLQEKKGNTCEKKMDLNANIISAKKKLKTLAWTTIDVGSKDLKHIDFKS